MNSIYFTWFDHFTNLQCFEILGVIVGKFPDPKPAMHQVCWWVQQLIRDGHCPDGNIRDDLDDLNIAWRLKKTQTVATECCNFPLLQMYTYKVRCSHKKKYASSHLVSDRNRPSENVGQLGVIFRKYDKNKPNRQAICRITCISIVIVISILGWCWTFPPKKVRALGHRATTQWSRRWPWATSSSETVWHGHSSHENSNATRTVAENTPTTPGITCTGTPDIINWPQTYDVPPDFPFEQGRIPPGILKHQDRFNGMTCLPNGYFTPLPLQAIRTDPFALRMGGKERIDSLRMTFTDKWQVPCLITDGYKKNLDVVHFKDTSHWCTYSPDQQIKCSTNPKRPLHLHC